MYDKEESGVNKFNPIFKGSVQGGNIQFKYTFKTK